MNPFSLTNKTIIITGGGSGIGLALALGLADHGADIILIGRRKDKLETGAELIRAKGRQAWTFPFDLKQSDDIASLFDEIWTTTEGYDGLINNAGINLRGPAEALSLEDWQAVIDINLTAMFASSQAFARRLMADKRPGKIINIASLAAHGARPSISPYNAAKSGVIGLTRSLGVEWAKVPINVNAICPGYFRTEMTQALADDPEFDSWVKSRTPMERWGDPKELVGSAVFLMSASSGFITGQSIYVDGGWTAAL